MKIDFKKRRVYFVSSLQMLVDEDFIMEFVFTDSPAHPNTVVRSEDITYFRDKLFESLTIPEYMLGKW